MKVHELIGILNNFDPNLEVHVGYRTVDGIGTWVAPKVNDVQETDVIWSEYHRMPKLIDAEPDPEYIKTVVVLNT